MDLILKKLGKIYGDILIWRFKKRYGECGKVINKLQMQKVPLDDIRPEYRSIAEHVFVGNQGGYSFHFMPLPNLQGVRIWSVDQFGYGLMRDVPWPEVTEENMTYIIKTQICEISEKNKISGFSGLGQYMIH